MSRRNTETHEGNICNVFAIKGRVFRVFVKAKMF